jgi:hypothetical protein
MLRLSLRDRTKEKTPDDIQKKGEFQNENAYGS